MSAKNIEPTTPPVSNHTRSGLGLGLELGLGLGLAGVRPHLVDQVVRVRVRVRVRVQVRV